MSSTHLCSSRPAYFLDDLKVGVREDSTKKGHILSEDGFKYGYQDNQESQEEPLSIKEQTK